MNILTSIPVQVTYRKSDSDVWVLNMDDVPVDANLIKDQQIVYLGPNAVGGNHKHPRIEWFIGIGDLLFIWLDENGIRHEEEMNPNGQLKLITVPPFLPHAVVNQSSSSIAILYEFADMKQKDVEPIVIVE